MGFARFVAIDWSGAKGPRQGGIQVAEIERDSSSPRLVNCPSGRRWGRCDVARFIVELAEEPTLVGLDFAFSVPWKESCGRPEQVKDNKELWALVDLLCAGAPHMYAGPIWTSPQSPFFPYIFHPQSKPGDRYDRKNLRMVEKLEGNAISIYHMVGVQVGAGSFSGMRMLHQIARSYTSKIAIWPFDEVDGTKTTVVEIYPSLFYRRAGARRPSKDELKQQRLGQVDKTLEYYGSKRTTLCRSVDQADALIAAAALKSAVCGNAFKFPNNHTFDLREGWIFGVPTGL